LTVSAFLVVGIVITGIGAVILGGEAVSEITKCVIDEIASSIGDVVDDVAYGILVA
jgi:hypothetical protein